MPKRLLDCCVLDFRAFSKTDLLGFIQKSENCIAVCEMIDTLQRNISSQYYCKSEAFRYGRIFPSEK